MKTYTLRYEETSVAYFDIDAETEVEAMQRIDEMKKNGEIDSFMGIIGSSTSVIGEKERKYAS